MRPRLASFDNLMTKVCLQKFCHFSVFLTCSGKGRGQWGEPVVLLSPFDVWGSLVRIAFWHIRGFTVEYVEYSNNLAWNDDLF